jgi:2-epi-5-epi-valiolone synthase
VADIFDPSNSLLRDCGSSGSTSKRFIVTDQIVDRLYGDRLRNYFEIHNIAYCVCVVAAGEGCKTIKEWTDTLAALGSFGIDRRQDPIICLGGGAVTDLGGFVASTYRRGTPFVRIPTTLIGYVDAAIGVKSAINFSGKKNLVGTYQAPYAVFLDRGFFPTLSLRHIVCGMAEIFKVGLIKDRYLYEQIRAYGAHCIQKKFAGNDYGILSRAITGMLAEIEPNLKEHTLERCMDFGHTFSPMLEEVDREIHHGEAVAIDMAFSLVIAAVLGLFPQHEIAPQFRLMAELGLPRWHPKLTFALVDYALSAMRKHRGGLIRLPLPLEIGECTFVNDLTRNDLSQALALHKRLCHEFEETNAERTEFVGT